MSGFVHFSRFLVFVEAAEHEFFRDLFTDPFFVHEGDRIGWPRLKVICNYKRPLAFGDVVGVELLFKKLGPATIIYDFRLEMDNATFADGQVTLGCGKRISDGLEPVAIPEFVIEKLFDFAHRHRRKA